MVLTYCPCRGSVLKMDSLWGKWPRLTLVDSRLWDGTAVHADLYAGVAPS